MRAHNNGPGAGDAGAEEVVDHFAELIDFTPTITQAADQHAAYVDVIQLWLERPLSDKRLNWLRSECAAIPRLRIGTPWWNRDRNLQQGLRLAQPSKAALEWLADRERAFLTYAELAFDYITDDEDSKTVLTQTFSDHFLQRWHRNRQSQLFTNGNGRTAKRGSPGQAWQWYGTRPSKLTGEVNTFHLEAWLQGNAHLRRWGIESVGDLLSFDYAGFLCHHLHNAFWVLDVERLGRFHACLLAW